MPWRIDLPAADLLLDAFEDHDVRVGGDADRQDQTRDARQRQRDRDQLDQRVEVEPVDEQAGDGDHAEHPVVGDQEHRDDQQPDEAGDQARVQRLLAERGRHLRLGDQLEVDRQRAEAQLVGEILGRADREAAADVGAVVAVDPVRVLLVVDERDRDQLVVERDREVLVERLPEAADELAALGDRPRSRSGTRSCPCELKPNVTSGSPVLGSVLCCGLRDVVAAQRDVVLEHEELRARVADRRRLGEVRRDRLEHDRPAWDGQDLALGRVRRPPARPSSRSARLSSGPESRQCWPADRHRAVGLGGRGARRAPGRPEHAVLRARVREFVELARRRLLGGEL